MQDPGLNTVRLVFRTVFPVALITLLLSGNSSAIEKRRGYVRETRILTCLDRCDFFHLDPDSGYSFIFLRADPWSTVNLTTYLDMHVEVTGFRAGCGGCSGFFVSDVLVLGTAGVADDPIIPGASLLNQNYPNPFNPATTIEYSLKSAAHVTIKIFDVLGHEASTLVSAEQHPGVHRITWDASGQPGGVYFYRLLVFEAGRRGLVHTKAMVLLR